MSNKIFIPKKINVGFQKRSDTYTGQLAYVIYYDQNGVLRKQASWESWRDIEITSSEFDNIPMDGFVLNKKVGGYKSDWNFRQTYVRIYDPRNFEFEITVPNLLFILENTSAIKGKGLEGQFVYGWDGTDLLLIPTSSPDYIKISNYSDMISQPEKIIGKDLVLGGIYRTNLNEDWIYLGHFERYEDCSWNKTKMGQSKGLYYFFQKGSGYETIKSLSGRIVKTVSAESVHNYAKLMEKLEHSPIYSPIDESKDEYVPVSLDEIKSVVDMNSYYNRFYISDNGIWKLVGVKRCYKPEEKDLYYREYDYNTSYSDYRRSIDSPEKLSLEELHNKYNFCKRKQYLKNGKSLKGE